MQVKRNLSEQELTAIAVYDELVRQKEYDLDGLWIDSFSGPIFFGWPTNGTILDVGCGVGRVLPLMLQAGVSSYVGIDPSSESIKYCKETIALAGYDFFEGDIRTLGTSYPAQFSGFVILTSLMHLPRPDLLGALHSLRQCLKLGAAGFVSTPIPIDGNELTSENSFGMLLTLFTPQELTTAFVTAGFQIVSTRQGEGMYLMHVRAV